MATAMAFFVERATGDHDIGLETFLWVSPWTKCPRWHRRAHHGIIMAYCMVHHGLDHGSRKCHGMYIGTLHGPMDCAMVHSMGHVYSMDRLHNESCRECNHGRVRGVPHELSNEYRARVGIRVVGDYRSATR